MGSAIGGKNDAKGLLACTEKITCCVVQSVSPMACAGDKKHTGEDKTISECNLSHNEGGEECQQEILLGARVIATRLKSIANIMTHP